MDTCIIDSCIIDLCIIDSCIIDAEVEKEVLVNFAWENLKTALMIVKVVLKVL